MAEANSLVVPLERVKPFRVTVAPIPGESLVGLVARSLQNTATRRLKVGLSLAGIDTIKPTYIASTVTRDSHFAGLARLLDVDEFELRARSHFWTPLPDGNSVGSNYFGECLRFRALQAVQRRVSPRALEISPHHRAIWNIRSLRFDPETLEPLLSHCPECRKELGWLRCYGISVCDKCLDQGGKPVVDLRDYKQPIIEVPDLDAVRVTFDLVSHDPAAKNRARARFGETWSQLGNGELFEAVLGLASALADEQADVPSAKVRSLAALQAEFMSKVGRAFIDGKSGVDRLFSEARARSGYNGSAQTIGCLRAPSKISLLSDVVRLELRLAAERHFLSEPIRKTSKWDALAPQGFIALGEVAKNARLGRQVTSAILNESGVERIRFGHRNNSFFYKADQIPETISNILTCGVASRLLSVSRESLDQLVGRKLIVRLFSTDGELSKYSRSSTESVLQKLMQFPWIPPTTTYWSIADALALIGIRSNDRVMALICILEGAVPAYRLPGATSGWPQELVVQDVEALRTAIFRVAEEIQSSSGEYVTSFEAAKIIGLTFETKMPALVQAGLISRRQKNSHVYSRGECLAFHRSYVFAREAKERIGFPSHRRLTKKVMNIKPVQSVRGIGRMYARKDFEDWLQRQ